MAIKTEIVWHKASEEPPEKSGDYAVANLLFDGRIYHLVIASYSAVHNAFNCTDDMTAEEVKQYAIPAYLWAEIPEVSNG